MRIFLPSPPRLAWWHLSCCLLLLAPVALAGAEPVVIIAAKTPLAALRAEQVAAIFLGQSARFPDGAGASAVDLPVGTPLRDAFYAQVANKSPALLKAYWTKMIFTGRAQPPQQAPDVATVRRLVATSPGLLGYIDKTDLDDSVKVLLVLR